MNRIWLLGVSLLLAAASHAAPRQTTLPELLAGKVAPLTLKRGDLDATWWRVGIEGGRRSRRCRGSSARGPDAG